MTHSAPQVQQLNAFILAHNRSRTPGVIHLTLGGSKPYEAVRDTRTHKLSIFSNGPRAEMVEDTVGEADRKLCHVFRDKFNEAERGFVPPLFFTMQSYQNFQRPKSIETQFGIIRVENNCPVYPLYPQFAYKGNSLFAIAIRIPSVFQCLAENELFKQMLIDGVNSPAAGTMSFDILSYIERTQGQGCLESLSLRKTENIIATDICRHETTTEPELLEFVTTSAQIETVIDEKAFSQLDQYGVIPRFLIVRPSKVMRLPMENKNFRLKAFVASSGDFVEHINSDQAIRIRENDCVVGRRSGDPECVIALYDSQMSDLESVAYGEFKLVRSGVYTPPVGAHAETFLFRKPISCKQASLDEIRTFPIIAQRKLDGDRIIIYAPNRGSRILYYSRHGRLQSRKFSDRFDSAVRSYISCFDESLVNVMLDCECYCHGMTHEIIGGLCNAIEAGPGFEKLSLYILSMCELDKLKTVKNETSSILEIERYRRMLPPSETELIKINQSQTISTRSELDEFMSLSVNEGFEGLVLYPIGISYVFGYDRLLKIKKIYDGECIVVGYNESPSLPGVIGSVSVKAEKFFGIRFLSGPSETGAIASEASVGDMATEICFFNVSAALTDKYKHGSMDNQSFRDLIGKKFTIICDSFSANGVPMHARFKNQFAPGNSRME